MLDHLSIQCDDAVASARFYDAVLATLGGTRIKEFGPVIGYGTNAPTFWIAPRTDAIANRQSHIAFRAADRSEVKRAECEQGRYGAHSCGCRLFRGFDFF